jgi:hypothetical protein
MKYIKACPVCGRMLRFPIDRGIIKVSCQCGSDMIIDPDNTELYKEGKFDLAGDKKPGKTENFKKSFRKKVNFKKIVNSLLEFKYKVQNISLMPDRDRNRLLLSLFTLILLLIFLLYLILL